jgi:hypothetical protein
VWGDTEYFNSFSIGSDAMLHDCRLFIDDISIQSSRETTIPEPSILVGLAGLLGMGLIGRWWRRRKAA